MKTFKQLSLGSVYFFWLIVIGGCSDLPSLSKSQPETATTVNNDSLTQTITNSLGVTSEQAASGAGALLSVAGTALSQTDFSKITGAIPDSGKLLNAGSFGTMNSLFKSGKLMEGYSQLSNLFESLGLNSSMITKFASVIMDYLKNSGGTTTSKLFQSALSSKLSGSAGSLLNAIPM